MATPLPFPGLSALLASYAKLFKSRQSYPLADGGDRPTITAIIPALNEERTIPYALSSLAIQTVTPDRIIVVDDGSTDDTATITRELDDELDVSIEVWQHDEPMGKTVGVKEVARSVETDTLFVLDADTFLEADDYLERVLVPHIESDVASSFGIAYPTETASKREFHDDFSSDLLPAESITRTHIEDDLDAAESRSGPLGYFRSNAPVVQYRNVSYHVEQRFFGDGFFRLFDSGLFPVGCAVMYDRAKLVSVFDDYEESLGNDLTNSEDIFIGFAFCDRGWKNVQVEDTYMRSDIPGLKRTFKQNYLWGSGFLQSAYYFKGLTTRYRKRKRETETEPNGSDGNRAEPESVDTETQSEPESVDTETQSEPESVDTETQFEFDMDVKETDSGSESDTPDESDSPDSPAVTEDADRLVSAESNTDTDEATVDGETERADSSSSDDDAASVQPPLGRAITARLIDGLYPTTILVFLVLSYFGVIGLEIVGFLVLWELTLYTVLVIATRSKRVHFARNFVPFVLIRTMMMPVLTYTYLRVATDVVTGNRNWRK
ncbi:glycosyltransferase family 2 protein [Natrinema halophilum]|uniref:Glycosyltransferase n=1 Tax=Natrinema halophilum TaxID=1699371 RepID=A0A7D5KAZ8_9EURY|nr:glycosyltransferase family A protein [Natrinema halophilum]QLG47416.1 glycosyltransferase [Natrinema halophilum]